MNVVEIRNWLHEHPQVSGSEILTHDVIVEHLSTLHPTQVYQHVGGYGVIAVWTHDASAEYIAVRVDIDALPIGHRCGHDGHTAVGLRLAELIDKGEKNVIVIFQPEEETGYGARKILESGILQQYNIKVIYGHHTLPGYKLGEVLTSKNTFAAASVGVIYHFKGRETHASTPEKGINPGCAIAEMIEKMDMHNSGNLEVDEFSQSTLICVRIGEEAFGTSAGEGSVMFTLRAFTNNRMEKLRLAADKLAQELAAKYGMTLEIAERDPFAATENNIDVVEHMVGIFSMNKVPTSYMEQPFRWSEDFGEYLRVYRGAFFGVGAGENCHELHHPEYNYPDELIEQTAHLFNMLIN